MEFLRRLFLSTRNHLVGLTVSQRLAIGLFVVVIAGSLVWLMQWAGEPEMVPLFNNAIAQEDATPVISQLERAGATYKYSAGDKLYVRRADYARLYAMLVESHSMPADATLGYAELIKGASSFTSQDEAQWRRNVALQNEMARIFSHFRGVRDARVIIDPSHKRGIGRAQTLPSASVFLAMKPGMEVDLGFAVRVAEGMAGAIADLRPNRVTVVDMATNNRFTVPDPDSPLSIDELGKRRANEKHQKDKIREALSYIPGVLVTVNAELVTDTTHTESTTFSGDPPPRKESSETTTETERSEATGPGVVPNTAVAVGTGAPTRSREEESRDTEFGDQRDRVHEVTSNLPFVPKAFKAAVDIPRAYFVAVYKEQPDATDPPDPDALKLLIENKKAEIKDTVKVAINAGDDDVVVHDYYGGYTMGPGGMLVAAVGVTEPAEAGAVMEYVETYGSQAGLGALAVISLLMMLMMVRRASEGPALPEDKPLVPEPLDDEMGILATESAPVGQAAATGGLLMAQEIDEGTLRSREIVDQLGKMVTDDPHAAAELVERWIQRDE